MTVVHSAVAAIALGERSRLPLARQRINSITGGGINNVSSATMVDASGSTDCINNVRNVAGLALRDEYKIERLENQSGADRSTGEVVVLKNTAAGDEFTTTTTQGDSMVCGVVIETIEGDTPSYGYVQTRGVIKTLKADGTADIAIGDLLGCFTTAGIAMKAASGDVAFAIALEAYTTNDSNGVLDALLIAPRQVK